jgi:serine/threonine protein kinase
VVDIAILFLGLSLILLFCRNVYGRISRKIDVYAFGVVLYELISAKTAVIKIDTTEFDFKTNESFDEYKSLVALVIDC